MNKTHKLTSSAMLTALAVILTLLSKAIPSLWMQGGSVTLASAVPIVTVSLLYGCGYGICAGTAFALIQMMTGFYPPPTASFVNFLLVIMLDYIVAFGIFGLADIIYRLFGRKSFAIPIAAFTVTAIRYICHIISGVLIWGVYAGEGQSVLVYSIIYNGSYMIPEIIITTAVTAIMIPLIKRVEKSRIK